MQVEVWVMRMEEGEQETLTDVIVGIGGGVPPPPVPLLPPPQPANRDERIAMKTNRIDRLEILPISQLRTKLTKAASLR